jgi:hypothetical protein
MVCRPITLCLAKVFATMGVVASPAGASPLVEILMPDEPTIGIPVAEQGDRAGEIASWVLGPMREADAAALGYDPETWAGVLPESQRYYIAALEPLGTGTGTLSDPRRVGADSRGLAGAILAGLDARPGDVAIYLDNAIDTSLSPVPFLGVDVQRLPAGDLVQVLAWDRTGQHPGRVPVLDGFRPAESFAPVGADWVDEGGGVFALQLGAVRPIMYRFGPAGQHVQRSGFIFEAGDDSELDGSSAGEHRFRVDDVTGLLRVRRADGQPPADLRATAMERGALFFGTERTFVDGLRVSGYDALGIGNNGYCVAFSADGTLHVARRVRADYALRHVLGMAYGGSESSRFSHWDCEFGIGREIGNSGYTSSVAYALRGGQHYTGVRPLFVEGTINTRRGAASISHRGLSGSSGSWIYVGPRIETGGGTGVRVGGHDATAPTSYSIVLASEVEQRQGHPDAAMVVHGGRAKLWSDVEIRHDSRGRFQFAGLETSGRVSTVYETSRLAIGGEWEPSVFRAEAYLHTRGGSNSFAGPARATYELRESVLDLSGWGGFGETGFFKSGSLAAAADAGVRMLDFRGVAVHAPANPSFRWFALREASDPEFEALARFEDCVFVGEWPASQVPDGARQLTRAAWAATDPASLRAPLATAWLVDHTDLLAALRETAGARLEGDRVRFRPVGSAAVDADFLLGVSVTPTLRPTEDELRSGLFATLRPGTGGVVTIGDRRGAVHVLVLHLPTGLIRGGTLLGPEPFADPDVSSAGAPGVPDGDVDDVDLAFYQAAWRLQSVGVAAGAFDADITGAGLDGVPDGAVDGLDAGYYAALWSAATLEPPPCPADITGPAFDAIPDRWVDSSDLQLFLDAFVLAALGEPTPGGFSPDVTGPALDAVPDGVVDAADLQYYLELWTTELGACPEWPGGL